jgi:hypothetical protein
MEANETDKPAAKPNVVMRVLQAINKDGTLAAAWRQGADEIGVALRAFPDSVHAEEPGTILNPTQGEIADSRKTRTPSPSEIAKDKKPYTPDTGNQNDHGRDR